LQAAQGLTNHSSRRLRRGLTQALGRRESLIVIQSEQPRESDLEHVVSLSGNDVEAIDAALLRELAPYWEQARDVVARAHELLQRGYPSVPGAFFSYRLRKLVATGAVQATGTVDRELMYQVRGAGHVPAA
jgi:hypothetical protein